MKKKIMEHIKKHKFIYSAILILFCFSGLVIAFYKLGVTDEIFTFANIYKLDNGVGLYSENNVIITPLYFYIGYAFLKIFGMNMFVYKLFGILIFEIIFLVILKILNKLNITISKGVIYIILILVPFAKILYINGPNYNTLAMLFWLIGMCQLIKKDKFEVKILEQGLISALIFASKQNIGIYYLIGLSIFTIYNYRANIKTILKKLFSIYIVFGIVTIAWIGILAIQGEFKDFINYCFLGIGEFSQKHMKVNKWYMLWYLIPLLTIIGVIIAKTKYHVSSENKILKITIFFLCFMISSLLIGYPLFNIYHITLAVFISIIYCIYIAEQVLFKMKDILDRKPVRVVLIGYIILVLLINIIQITKFTKFITSDEYNVSFDNPYFGMYITEEWKNKINEIINFIEEKKQNNQEVVIFSNEANIYQILLKQNYQDFDLPHLGNWGYKGEERVLNKIKNLKDTFILIKEDKVIKQESETIKEYIKDNYNKTGDIAGFEIYYIE